MSKSNQSPKSSLAKTIKQQKEEIARLRADNALLKKQNDAFRPEESAIAYKSIIELMPGNVYWKDKNGRYRGVNNNAARLAGFASADELVGKCDKDLFGPATAKQLAKIDAALFKSGNTHYLEETAFNEKKEPAIYLTQKILLRDALGNPNGVLGISFDITDRKKMEEELKIAKKEAEAAYKAKSQFLAITSHELRTPVAGLLGMIAFLREDKLTASEEKKIIRTMEDCAEHLLNLINDVLDVSKLESQTTVTRFEWINLKTLLHEIYNILYPLAHNKGLEFHIESPNKIPAAIFCDARILRQILINLVNNAIKFTEHGHVTIRVENLEKKQGKTRLKIIVIDSGIGISPDKLDIIFKPFQQLGETYTRQSSRRGTGLGLTIVEKLAASINMKISVISKPENGSEFSLTGEFETDDSKTLMITTPTISNKDHAEEEASQESTIQPIYPNQLARQPQILLVEDDPVVQYVHHKMLTDIGCQVDVCDSGEEALLKLRNHDIVFVDISLPDMSGFTLIQSIKQRHYNHIITIIALTAHSNDTERNASLNAGADQFVVKPISWEALRSIVLRYMTRDDSDGKN